MLLSFIHFWAAGEALPDFMRLTPFSLARKLFLCVWHPTVPWHRGHCKSKERDRSAVPLGKGKHGESCSAHLQNRQYSRASQAQWFSLTKPSICGLRSLIWHLPFYQFLLLEAIASRQKVIPVVLKLVSMTAVMDPDVRHTRDSSGKAQQVFPSSAMLVRNQETLIGCITLRGR